MAWLCSPHLPIFMILAILMILSGVLVTYQVRVRRSKDLEVDWNHQLLAAMIILSGISLALFIGFIFIHFGRC